MVGDGLLGEGGNVRYRNRRVGVPCPELVFQAYLCQTYVLRNTDDPCGLNIFASVALVHRIDIQFTFMRML